MGEVFLARDPDLDRQVAIKVLSGPAAADPAARRSFLREGRAAGRVSHPNIVAIHEVGPAHLADFLDARPAPGGADRTTEHGGGNGVEPDGPVYLVMDYAGDGSVEDLLRDGPLSPERATAILADAAAGLAAAHEAGLVHRDVKPANLMLEHGGPWAGGCVKVTDFGLARRLDEGPEETGPGADDDAAACSAGDADAFPRDPPLPGGRERQVRRKVVGTPHFMSPEQCRGQPVDARSDLYSLGATYHALLAGRPPFAAPAGTPARPVTAVLNAHKRSDPPPVHELRDLPAAVSPACTRMIVRAMAKDPADRYPGAEALRRDALALLDAIRKQAANASDVDDSAAEGSGEIRTRTPVDPVLPSERPAGATGNDAANGSAVLERMRTGTPHPASTFVSNSTSGSGVHDPAAETPAAGTAVEDPAGFRGPPPGVRREIFSLAGRRGLPQLSCESARS